jgi:hypothetical protein
MARDRLRRIVSIAFAFMSCSSSIADDSPAARRRQESQQFHVRAQERPGVLIPMYVYPSDIEKNAAYNRLINVKRRCGAVPIWVILNPATGPGKRVDPNYTRAIDRLRGAGCVVLGYVSTSYAKRPEAEVRSDIDTWLRLYPRVHGIFFDEMVYDDSSAASKHQAALNQYAHDAGCWPTVANPGADTPDRYFASGAADVIVIHEGNFWPTEARLKGDHPGGYVDYPPFTRGLLVHSQPRFDRAALQLAVRYVRWIYVTEGAAANPWDRLSGYLDQICSQFAEL